MEILCTRPKCSNPKNFFSDLDSISQVKTASQKYCATCGMPLILADRYIPEKLLGQGGFGAAFLARDRYSPKFRYCVVKQFKPSGNLSPQDLDLAQELFAREGVVLEELGNQHPQIPDLYAFFTPIVSCRNGQDNEQYFYLVQEYIDGQDLESELEQKGQFSETEVLQILQEVLKILDFIHQRNVIHRDIKPSNIMRDRNGKIYLLDFGAVKQIASGANSGKSTGIYSMGFAPPEQMAGKQVYPATDLYALAVTCISLLTGKPAEQLYDSYHNCWVWRNYAPVNEPLDEMLDKMLMSIPAQRYQSATEVLSLLNSTSSTSSTSPAPSTSVSQNPPTSSASSTIVASPVPSTPSKPPVRRNPPNFSLVEILGSAAFTGFEGALLAIFLTNLFAVSGVSLGILGASIAGLIYAQTRRIIEKIDLVIIAGISAAIVFFFPVLQGGLTIGIILVIAAMSGAGAIAITALFRLIYQILARLL
ncbi:Serine/threonine-protein kinase F [Hyella patelloides LEGE 07179]|uniref:non-specific serine/threonine protein kinase n=1 Tax=Hyella patelloides LEGE 07179 TaxID=945734 RepID=A0A563W551_9CYAN|nr:bifunctional serine/threonine protein kinase/MFS transporter [Hyella patelloides]VEP18795.1 Serine/threonine-protein kinase F [Hyella patelloides LEGE 07179]